MYPAFQNAAPQFPEFPHYQTVQQSPLQHWQPYNPWQGAPGGAVGPMLMQLFGSSIAQNTGMTPMSFSGNANMYQIMRDQQFTRAHNAGFQGVAQQDAQIFFDTGIGALNMAGVDTSNDTEEGRQNRQRLLDTAETVTKLAPFYANFAQALDVVSGGRSATNLYAGMHLTGRIAQDPVTGRRGMTAASAAHIAHGLYDNYYSDPHNWRQYTAGLSSLDMRYMNDEMQRRGLMPGTGDLRQRVSAGLAALTQPGMSEAIRGSQIDGSATYADAMQSIGRGADTRLDRLSDDELRQLSQDQGVQFGMRSAHAGRMRDTIDKYKGALAAVREIFGDNGRPDAPMQELWDALDAMTSNSVSQLDPATIEMQVRKLRGVAKTAEISIQQMLEMTQVGFNMTQNYGLNAAFAPSLAQSGMLFTGAYNEIGGGSIPAWGLASSAELSQMEMSRTARAATSTAANRASLLLKIADQFGIDDGTQAAAWAAAAKEGNLHAMDPEFATQSTAQFLESVAQDTGISRDELQYMLGDKEALQEYSYRYNVAEDVKRMQKHELARNLMSGAGGTMTQAAYSRLSHLTGARGVEASKAAMQMANVMSASLMSMETPVFRNEKARNLRVAADLDALITQRADAGDEVFVKLRRKLDSMTDDEERQRALTTLASTGYSLTDQAMRERGMDGGMMNFHALSNDEVVEARDRNMQAVHIDALLDSARAGEFDSSAWRRFFTSVQEAGDPDAPPDQRTLAHAVGKALGMVDNDELAQSLARTFTDLTAMEDELAEVNRNIDAQGDAPANAPYAAELKKDRDRLEAEIKQRKAELTEMAQSDEMREALGEVEDETGAEPMVSPDEVAASDGGPGGGPGAFEFGMLRIGSITFSSKDMEIKILNADSGPARGEAINSEEVA